jgi:hypothetical protein
MNVWYIIIRSGRKVDLVENFKGHAKSCDILENTVTDILSHKQIKLRLYIVFERRTEKLNFST